MSDAVSVTAQWVRDAEAKKKAEAESVPKLVPFAFSDYVPARISWDPLDAGDEQT